MRRRAGSAGAIVILTTAALLTGPGAAFAKTPAATVERATVTTPINEPADACGAPATMVGDDVLSYQSVQTDQGFHFAGTDRVAFVLTAADGTYAVGGSTDHPAFDAVAGEVRT